ncbi:MAG: hypothetical protein Q6365_008440 [Candidatus Sigynarchaeota archaeon]
MGVIESMLGRGVMPFSRCNNGVPRRYNLSQGGGFSASAAFRYLGGPGRLEGAKVDYLADVSYYIDIMDMTPTYEQTVDFRRELHAAFTDYVKKFKDDSLLEARAIRGYDILSMVMRVAKPSHAGLGDSISTYLNKRDPYRMNGVIDPARAPYLHQVVDGALARYCKEKLHQDLATMSPQQQQDARVRFIAGLLWHDNGAIPKHTKRDAAGRVTGAYSVNLPVLSEAMIYFLSEGMRRVIENTCRDRDILGEKVTPATAKNRLRACEALKAMEDALRALLAHRPDLQMKAKDATDVSMPAWADHEGFFMQGALLKAVYDELMKVPAALFEGIFPAGYFVQDVDLAFGEYGRAYDVKLAENLPDILLNSGYVFGDKGNQRIFERLLQVVRGAGGKRYLELLLAANGLHKVGASWMPDFDGYEYFEVADAKGGPRMLCRVYRGDVTVLHQGIEIFLDARLDGELPDYTCPASATGHLDGPDGLKTGVEAKASAVERMDAYRQWLAMHQKFRTKYLDEFYTHYAYPTS